MKILLRIVAVFVLSTLAATGCAQRGGPTNPPSQVGRLAQSGRQVIAASDSVLSGVDQLVTSNVLSKADATKVVEIIGRVGKEGERLSQILTVADQTQDVIAHEKGLQQAAEILKAINRLVIEAGSGIGNETARGKVVAMLAQITDVVVSIALLFPSN